MTRKSEPEAEECDLGWIDGRTPQERLETAVALSGGGKGPKLEVTKDGDPIVTPELLSFASQAGMSLDWLFRGALVGMLSPYQTMGRVPSPAPPKTRPNRRKQDVRT